MKLNLGIWTVAYVGLGLLASCAKERTLEDWRRDRVSEQLAQIQARSGSYSGFTRLSTGEKIGFQLTVESDTQISSTRDSISTAPQASLQGRIRLWLENSVQTLRFRGGFIDPNTGSFKAEIPVALRNGKQGDFSISGTLEQGQARGRFGAAIYPELSSDFEASLGGDVFPSEKVVAKIPGLLGYSGEIQWRDGSHSPGRFRMTQSPANAEQEVYDLFDEIRWTHVEAEIDGSQFLIPSQWRLSEKRLIGIFSSGQGGQGGTPVSSFSARLECIEKKGGAVAEGWDCSFGNVTPSAGVGFTVSLVP